MTNKPNRIRFRAWDNEQKKMIYQDFLFINSESDGGCSSLETTLRELEKRYTIMQSTGLVDKNGTEIFEGDVVSVFPCFGFHQDSGWGYEKCVITYKDAHFYREIHYSDARSIFDPDGKDTKYKRTRKEILEADGQEKVYLNTPERMQIIGNIHENPELLK